MKNLLSALFALILAACGPSLPVPDWAQGFKPGEFSELKEAIEALPGLKSDIAKGTATAGEISLDLGDLAELCYYLDRDEYKLTASQWLQDAKAVEDLLRTARGDYARVAPGLVLKLVPRADPSPSTDFLDREDLPGLHTRLAYQNGLFIRPLRRRETEAWARSPSALFIRASTNTILLLAKHLVITREETIPGLEDSQFFRISGESPILASIALFPASLACVRPGSPALWAVPNSRTLFYTPLHHIGRLMAGNFLVDAMLKSGLTRPGQLSKQLLYQESIVPWKISVLEYQTNFDRLPEVKYPPVVIQRVRSLAH
jgi:hypothetical protein